MTAPNELFYWSISTRDDRQAETVQNNKSVPVYEQAVATTEIRFLKEFCSSFIENVCVAAHLFTSCLVAECCKALVVFFAGRCLH